MKYIKVYGLQRSGTNYLKWVLEQNFDCFVLQNYFGWKHGHVVFLNEGEHIERDLGPCALTTKQREEIRFQDVHRIAIKKNVYSWLVSYYKYKHFNWNKDHKKLIDRYYEMNRHWQKHCFMVDYDDLLLRTKETLLLIMNEFGLHRKVEWVLEHEKTMPRAGDDHSSSWKDKYENHKFNKLWYENESYMGHIPNLDQINRYILRNYEDDSARL